MVGLTLFTLLEILSRVCTCVSKELRLELRSFSAADLKVGFPAFPLAQPIVDSKKHNTKPPVILSQLLAGSDRRVRIERPIVPRSPAASKPDSALSSVTHNLFSVTRIIYWCVVAGRPFCFIEADCMLAAEQT